MNEYTEEVIFYGPIKVLPHKCLEVRSESISQSVISYLPRGGWRLNHGHAIGGRCLNFVRESWRACLADVRIVDLRIADHTHEEGSFVGERLFLLAVQDLGQLVMVVLRQREDKPVNDGIRK